MAQLIRIHQTAEVSPTAVVGAGTQVWNGAQLRDGARVGSDCVLGKGVFVDVDVVIGDRVKLENNVSLFRGARIADGAFVGPHTCLLNDKRPRAITPLGTLKAPQDWVVSGVTVGEGASIGGGCTVLPGVTVGAFALVGAGAVVATTGARFAVATSNGTTALYLALVAHGVGPGDEVITSALTFIATANAIAQTGARPVLADVDDSLNLDPKAVAALIGPRTKA